MKRNRMTTIIAATLAVFILPAGTLLAAAAPAGELLGVKPSPVTAGADAGSAMTVPQDLTGTSTGPSASVESWSGGFGAFIIRLFTGLLQLILGAGARNGSIGIGGFDTPPVAGGAGVPPVGAGTVGQAPGAQAGSPLPQAQGPAFNGSGRLNLPLISQAWGGRESRKRGCGPASLLMAVSQGRSVSRSEAARRLQPILEQTCARPGGMIAGRAVKWLHRQGFRRSRIVTSPKASIDFLRRETAAGHPVLVRIINKRTGNGHYVVVTGVGPRGVYVNDPGGAWKPNEPIPFRQFERWWAQRNNLSIVVER